MRKTGFALACAIFLITTIPMAKDADENNPTPAPMQMPLISGGISIDGVIDETAWERASHMSLTHEISPAENAKAPVKTDVYFMSDAKNVYIAFKCYDPEPGKIMANFADHDRCWRDDLVGIFLDTFNDQRRGYLLMANPAGCKYDAIKTDNNEDNSWDAIWDAAGHIADWGYSVEFAIPYSALSFQDTNGDPQTWGFDPIRIYPREVRHQILSHPLDRNNDSLMAQFSKVHGFSGANPGKNIEIQPTLTALKTDARNDFPFGEMEEVDRNADFGITGKWGITNNITLGATMNPDFSQVEADAMQLDINSPFALDYQEKRPFFTQGLDFFRTEMRTVYTRNLRDPEWGMKLMGKEAGNTFGAYFVEDNITNILFPGAETSSGASLDQVSRNAIFRYKRDVGRNYTFGALATHREAGDYSSTSFGADGRFRLTDTDTIQFQTVGSQTQYPDQMAVEFEQPEGQFGGMATQVSYNHSDRKYFWFVEAQDISEDFRADLGFMPRVGYRFGVAGFGRNWRNQGDTWWSRFDINGNYSRYDFKNGDPMRRRFQFNVNYGGLKRSELYQTLNVMDDYYDGQLYERMQYVMFSRIYPTGRLALELGGQFGDAIDYANSRQGTQFNVRPGMNFAVNKNLSLSLRHKYEHLDVDGGRLYTANITYASIIYQFSVRMLLRAIVQYVDYQYESDLYINDRDPEFRRMLSQLLFSYKINPRTVLYLGYNDSYRGNHEFDMTQGDRTFFVKLGYAWMM